MTRPGIILLALAFAHGPTHADPAATIEDVHVAGNGCKKKDVDVLLTTDGAHMALLFGEFASVARHNGKGQKQTCNLRITIRLAPGTRAAVTHAQWRGLAALAGTSAWARFERSYRWSLGPSHDESIEVGPGYTNLLLEDAVTTAGETACGGTHQLHVHTHLAAHGLPGSLLRVRSADAGAAAVLELALETCAVE